MGDDRSNAVRRCRWGVGVPGPTGEGSEEKNFDFGSQIGEFWCELGVFLYSSPKVGLNAVLVRRIAKLPNMSNLCAHE